MQWKKKGLIFTVSGNHEWMMTHAQVPVVDKVTDEVLRIYFGTRDVMNRTVTTFIEVRSDDPAKILYVHDRPVLGLGNLGAFDDSGAMPSWIVNHGAQKYLYYTGWNVGKTVPYQNAIGLSVSRDQGRTFTRLFDGPILDRTHLEPYFCAVPCVFDDNGVWRMWYLSCTRWEIHDGKPEPYYHIKYAESTDGIHWNRNGSVAIDFKSPAEAGIVRPSVLVDGGIYKMWYSYRGISGYRTSSSQSYRIGYAESKDGVLWTRKDENVGIDVSPTGWDSTMVAYPYVYLHNGKTYMIYNGNGFGKSGFGYAVLTQQM
jgi:hypothetical protein